MIARLATLAAALAAIALAPGVALAQCASGDLACIQLPDVPSRPAHLVATGVEPAGVMTSASAPTSLTVIGDVLPRGEHSIVHNAEYYGLPPVSDGWVYMRVGQDAFRVDWQTHQVLERVTDEASANF